MGPLIALALQYAPDLIGLLAGAKAGQVTSAVIDATKKIFGTDDPADVQSQIQADANKLEQFKAELQSVTDRFKLQVEDTQDARHQTIALVQAGSAMAWGAVTISILVTISFAACLIFISFAKVNFNDITGQVFLLLTGTLSAAFTQVINYWLGSSASSKLKDFALTVPQTGKK